MLRRVSLLAASLLLLAPAARALESFQGLTVAVSPDGKQLVAGGNTRTLVVMNPETLEVKDRVWIEMPILRLAFNQQGTVLAVESDNGQVMLFEAGTWKKKKDLGKRDSFVVAPKADVIAGCDMDYNAPSIHLHSLTDGTEKSKIALTKDQRPAAFGLNADATRLAVLTNGKDDPEEKKVAYNDIPKDLKDFARDEFVQRNDGRTATFLLFNTADGKVLLEKKVFYTLARGIIWFQGEDALVMSSYNVHARISPKGDIKAFDVPGATGFGTTGVSADGGTLLIAGSTYFSVAPLATMKAAVGQVDRLPIGSENFIGNLSGTTGATANYGGTTAYRVARFGADGKLVKVMPIK